MKGNEGHNEFIFRHLSVVNSSQINESEKVSVTRRAADSFITANAPGEVINLNIQDFIKMGRGAAQTFNEAFPEHK